MDDKEPPLSPALSPLLRHGAREKAALQLQRLNIKFRPSCGLLSI